MECSDELTGNTLDRLLLCLMRCRSFSSFVHFGNGSKMRVVPLTLKEANLLVETLHRHHKPVQGHRFSLGLKDASGTLVGAAICGRPVARLAGDPSEVLEVTRFSNRWNIQCLLHALRAEHERVGT